MYYNPAKTIGGMFEADSFCLVAWLYSALMNLSGLSLFWWLDVQPGFELLADFVLIIWVGLTIWGLTWMKVWMSKPTFNSGKCFGIQEGIAKNSIFHSMLNVSDCSVRRVSAARYRALTLG